MTSLPKCGFIAQLVEHCTGIAEVTGSNPVEALIFFRLLLFNCLNWKIYCDDHSSSSFLPSFDQVNCVEMERASITVSRIREDTRGNPVVSRTIYCILHGRSAKNCTLDKLQIYYSNQPVYRRRWLHPSWYQTSDSFQICCVIGVTFESSWNGQHKFLSQPRSRC